MSKKQKKQEFNSKIVALSIFQFGIFLPLSIILGSQIINALITLLIFGVLFITNQFVFKKRVVILYILISLLFLVNSLFTGNSLSTLFIYLEFSLKCFSLVLIGAYNIKGIYFYNTSLKLAIINFWVLVPLPFIGLLNDEIYMRYGYAILPSVLFFLIALVKEHNFYKWFFYFIVSSMTLFVYGSRSPILCIMLLIILLFITTKKIKRWKKIAITGTLSFLTILSFELNIPLKILDFLYYNLNIKTYSIEKLQLALNNGMGSSSSGRDVIYGNLMELFKEKPIFGHGLGITHKLWDITAHNLFLQAMVEFGLIGLIITIVLLIYALLKMRYISKIDIDSFHVLSVIFSISFGRLLLSSDIWLRPELWLFISLLINYKYNEELF